MYPNRKGIFSLVGLTILTVLWSSCRHDTDLSNIREISYQGDISNIIIGKCGSSNCHGDSKGHNEGEAGSLIGYENVIGYGEVKAGDAWKSKLYKVCKGSGFEGLANKMPPSGSPGLSNEELKMIFVWIQQGAKNN